jgi:uncharacterized RDD family membrane protein YckC
MSDIPVGSPPVPPGRHAAPGGWYADPVDPARERYWDGWQWSRNTRPREGQPPPYAAAAGTTPARYPGAGPTGYSGPGPSGYTGPAPGTPAPGPVPGGYGQPGYPPNYPAAPAYPGRTGPVAVTADGVPLAGWWWRVLAAVIDNIILSTVVTILAVPLWMPVYEAFMAYWEAIVDAQRTGVPLPVLDPNQLFPIRAQMLLTALTVGIGLIYHVTFLRWKGATVGKLACRLRVVPVDRGLSRPGLPWNATLIRAGIWVLPGISSLFALFTVVDVLFPLWQPKRQALHDLAAKTQVIRAR